MKEVWSLIYESGNLSVRKWNGLISLIRTDLDGDIEIIIDEAELEKINEAYEESEE
jgi:hypothetical protein